MCLHQSVTEFGNTPDNPNNAEPIGFRAEPASTFLQNLRLFISTQIETRRYDFNLMQKYLGRSDSQKCLKSRSDLWSPGSSNPLKLTSMVEPPNRWSLHRLVSLIVFSQFGGGRLGGQHTVEKTRRPAATPHTPPARTNSQHERRTMIAEHATTARPLLTVRCLPLALLRPSLLQPPSPLAATGLSLL